MLSKKRKRKLRSFLESQRYRLINRFSGRRPLSSDDRVIVSVTTHPPRIGYVSITLETLLAQDLDAFDVHLYLSQRDMNTLGQLPASLQRLVDRGLKVIITDEDYRSYDKLVHALSACPNATIITADDDMMYPRDWARRLVEGARQFPGCIVCHRGHMLRESEPGSGRISYQQLKGRRDSGACQPSLQLMPTGSGGVLYPPGALDPMVFDVQAFQHLAPNADDIWFKMASLKRGTRCVRVNAHNVDFLATRASTQSALHEENTKQGGNDIQMASCLARYPELKAMLFVPD